MKSLELVHLVQAIVRDCTCIDEALNIPVLDWFVAIAGDQVTVMQEPGEIEPRRMGIRACMPKLPNSLGSSLLLYFCTLAP